MIGGDGSIKQEDLKQQKVKSRQSLGVFFIGFIVTDNDCSWPNSPLLELDGVTFDLNDVCEQLRHGIEVRNRSSMKRLHKCSFVGTTAVGFLVSSGIVPNRSKAISLGRILQEKGYIRHVTDQSKFKDAQV
jgi:hypothetical protein